MSLTLYFVRHGETVYSKTGGFCGDLDPELTAEGHLMADDFLAAYRQIKWEAIYASPMKRTMAMAQPLCNATGLKLQLRDGLKEIKYGDWEGKTLEIVQQTDAEAYALWVAEPAWNAPPGGETALAIANRAALVMAEIAATYRDGNILIVSHKATIRVLLCYLLGIDLGRYRQRLNVLAGSVSVVKIGAYGPMLEILGDRSYLRERLRALPGT